MAKGAAALCERASAPSRRSVKPTPVKLVSIMLVFLPVCCFIYFIVDPVSRQPLRPGKEEKRGAVLAPRFISLRELIPVAETAVDRNQTMPLISISPPP